MSRRLCALARSAAPALSGFGVREVRGHDDRAAVLPALVHDRVELLQHPLGLLLRAQVVQHEQVDGAEPPEDAHVAVGGVAVEGALDLGEETRHGEDGVGAPGVLGGLRHQDGEGGLAGPDGPVEPQPAAGLQVLLHRAGEGAHLAEDGAVERHDRLAVERHLEEAPPDAGADPAAGGPPHALVAAAAGAGVVGLLVEDPGGAVALAIGAGGLLVLLVRRHLAQHLRAPRPRRGWSPRRARGRGWRSADTSTGR